MGPTFLGQAESFIDGRIVAHQDPLEFALLQQDGQRAGVLVTAEDRQTRFSERNAQTELMLQLVSSAYTTAETASN